MQLLQNVFFYAILTAVPRRLTLEEMQEIAASRGGSCLSIAYKNKDAKLRWKCHLGHEWEATPHHIKISKSWCPVCAHRVPLQVEEARELAASRGGTLLSTPNRLTVDSRLLWRCQYGHEWEAFYGPVRQGSWCAHCAGKQYTIEDMHALAALKGGKCLSPVYLPMSKLRWSCSKGHEWEAIPTYLRSGYWCPTCVGRGKTLVDMQEVAKQRGGRCLSTEYKTVMSKLLWECAKGHTWETTYNNIVSNDSWCPQCKTHRKERLCRTTFEELLGVAFPKTRPSWLVNSRGNKMELDGYAEGLRLAFEYQGIQHYQQSYHQTAEDFAWQQQKDAEKRALCAGHGVHLIEVPWSTSGVVAFIHDAVRSYQEGATIPYNGVVPVVDFPRPARPVRKGFKHSEATKAKLSAIHKGKPGHKPTPEQVENRVQAYRATISSPDYVDPRCGRRGHHHSPEARAKMSEAHKGRKVSLEARAKMSKSRKGSKRSPEARAKMSEAQKQRWARRHVAL